MRRFLMIIFPCYCSTPGASPGGDEIVMMNGVYKDRFPKVRTYERLYIPVGFAPVYLLPECCCELWYSCHRTLWMRRSSHFFPTVSAF